MLVNIIIWIVLGAVAGWIASRILKGHSSGFVMNTILGIVGSVVGGWLFGALGISLLGALDSFIAAVIGAMVLIVIVNAASKR